MNPFLLRGPDFLLLYLVLSALVLGRCWLRFRVSGGEDKPRLTELTSDPYRIACLRGGREEAIRVATFNLVDRGIVNFAAGMLATHRADASRMLRNALEQAVANYLTTPQLPGTLLRQTEILRACDRYVKDLERAGLLPDAAARRAQFLAAATAIGILGGGALVKIVVAVSHGHTNVLFLVLLSIASCMGASTICRVRITPAGKRALNGLQALFQRLRDQGAAIRPGGGSGDALLLACIFGLSALPLIQFPFVSLMFPRPRTGAGSLDSGSSSCGSSCGGSGCGGGGCGGCGS